MKRETTWIATEKVTFIETRFLCLSIYEGGFWIRLFGRGISVKNTTKRPLWFSERNGLVRRLAIGKWSIRWLSA